MKDFINKHIKWVFSLPALIFMLVMIAVPIVMTMFFSLNDWNLLMGNGMKFNFGKIIWMCCPERNSGSLW